jgi:hypothetical protein
MLLLKLDDILKLSNKALLFYKLILKKMDVPEEVCHSSLDKSYLNKIKEWLTKENHDRNV